MIIINESGLYALILSSKLSQAKAFKRWVTSEVLPQIRRTGGYIPTKDGV
jgi:prophage antirepressor-like protein